MKIRIGDIALCGLSKIGLITNNNKIKVLYQDGNSSDAYVGIHLADDVGSEWSSRNPKIIGNIFDLFKKYCYNKKRNNKMFLKMRNKYKWTWKE